MLKNGSKFHPASAQGLNKVQFDGGPHGTVDSILASRPTAPGSILGVPKIFSEKILDVVEIY